MKDIMYKKAGIGLAILGLVLIVLIYTLLGSVDLVYVVGEREAYRQENARVVTKIDDPVECMSEEFLPEGGSVSFTYKSGDETKTLNTEKPLEIKMEIAKTIVKNLFTFQWKEQNYVINFTAK